MDETQNESHVDVSLTDIAHFLCELQENLGRYEAGLEKLRQPLTEHHNETVGDLLKHLGEIRKLLKSLGVSLDSIHKEP